MVETNNRQNKAISPMRQEDCLHCLGDMGDSLPGQHKVIEAMFAHSNFSFALFDRHCHFIRVNDNFAQIFGKQALDFKGHHYSELLPDENPQYLTLRKMLEQTIQSGRRERLTGYPHHPANVADTTYWDWLTEPMTGAEGGTELVLLTAIEVTDLKRAEEDLRRSESLYQTVVTVMAEGVICQSADGKITAINPAAAHILGRSSEEMLTRSSTSPGWNTVYPDGSPFLPDDYPSAIALRTGKPQYNTIMGLTRPDGERIWISLNSQPITDATETDAVAVVTTLHNITQQKLAEATQQRLNRALRLLSQCNQILIHADNEQKLLEDICRLIVESGGYLMTWVGYAEHDAYQSVRPVAEFGYGENYLHDIRISWGDNENGRGPTGVSIRNGRTSVNQDYLINPQMLPWREAAVQRGFQSSISLPLKEGASAFGALAIYSKDPYCFSPEEVQLLEELADDLAFGICTLRAHARRKTVEEQLAFLAHHDPLTHLPNRMLLREKFETEVRAHHGRPIAMLFLDLDGFKEINDSLGHGVGDELLVSVVARLQHCLDENILLSREGGDEFVVLLPLAQHREQAVVVAEKMLEAARESFQVGSNTIHTSFSIGISVYPQDGLDFDTLRKNADIALYRAKEGGRNNYRYFTEQMNVAAKRRMQLQTDLHSALRHQDFRLEYQPQVNIADGRIIGMEALLRWHHADGEVIPPNHFIPVAEQSGLIIPIGTWVLEQACRQAAQWQAQGLPELIIAVNLSAVQFRHGNIVETVAQALANSGLASHQLELELTESILLQDTETSIKTLHTLNEIGVKLSIDDFGTGYSSLAYLKRLAVDKLKIDQSFVRDLTDDPDNQEIVRAIIQLGHILKLEIIAEGVETEGQRTCLSHFGCDQIQGYLISKPLPAEQIPLLFAR